MNYISTQDAAEKWGVSLRYVQRLLHEARIPGARKYGITWLIPEDSKKPIDKRRHAESLIAAECALSVFPQAYLCGGDLDGAYARCTSEWERALLDASIALFRADAAAACRKAAVLLQEAATPRQKLGCLTVLSLAYMSQFNLHAWKDTMAQMEALTVFGEMRMEKELLTALAKSAMHGRTGYPKWIETGDYACLAPELFPLARYVFIKLLYIKWKEVDLLAAVEPLIAESHRDGCDFSEIYLRLIAAIAYHDFGDKERAAVHIRAAADLALPLGFISPFIEHGGQLSKFIVTCLDGKYPEECAFLKKQTRPFFSGWVKMYNELWPRPMAELTPREFEACSLFSRGMGVNEIARRMDISKNSVKKYLNVAYSKMDISDRNQLIHFIHT